MNSLEIFSDDVILGKGESKAPHGITTAKTTQEFDEFELNWWTSQRHSSSNDQNLFLTLEFNNKRFVLKRNRMGLSMELPDGRDESGTIFEIEVSVYFIDPRSEDDGEFQYGKLAWQETAMCVFADIYSLQPNSVPDSDENGPLWSCMSVRPVGHIRRVGANLSCDQKLVSLILNGEEKGIAVPFDRLVGESKLARMTFKESTKFQKSDDMDLSHYSLFACKAIKDLLTGSKSPLRDASPKDLVGCHYAATVLEMPLLLSWCEVRLVMLVRPDNIFEVLEAALQMNIDVSRKVVRSAFSPSNSFSSSFVYVEPEKVRRGRTVSSAQAFHIDEVDLDSIPYTATGKPDLYSVMITDPTVALAYSRDVYPKVRESLLTQKGKKRARDAL
jgi:hypothetical protein